VVQSARRKVRGSWIGPLAALVMAGALTIPALFAQAPPADAPKLSFEVASVKPNQIIDVPRGGRIEPGRFTQTGVTLQQLIRMPYGQSGAPMFGGPNWIDSDRFDVEGKGNFTLAGYLPGRNGSAPPVYSMLRSLLEERFQLRLHTEQREMPVYALVMAGGDRKLGPQLTRSDVDCDAMLDAIAKTGKLPAPPQPGKAPPCSAGPRPGGLVGEDLSMERLANLLSGQVNRTVKDRTGLKGNFDVMLTWTPDDLANNTSGISIFTALQEQLGLKLEATRGPVTVVVIDHVEHPTPD
jgi:uncharacterized protein (TIGR03435 family)